MISPALSSLHRPKRSKAFTMLEVMIAITILAVIIGAIYSCWLFVVRASKIGLDTAAQVQRTRMAMRCLVDSLLCLQMFDANKNLYYLDADTKSDMAYLSFVARLPSSFPDAGLFGDQVLRRVTFEVVDGQLKMYQMPLLTDTNSQQKPFEIVLAKNVNLFALDFWSQKTNDWSGEWTTTNQIPLLVRVTLGYAQPRGSRSEPDICTRVIAMPNRTIPIQVQIPTLGGGSGPPPLPGQGNPGTVIGGRR